MIPVEYFWLVLILVLGIIGAVRGLAKELGVTTIVLLTLFVLKFAWQRFGPAISGLVDNFINPAYIEALYYTIPLIFVTIISYTGFTLMFPVKDQGGLGKGILGFLGGLLNGYLIIGSIWDVFAHANYFYPSVQIVSPPCTAFHNTIINYLPVTFISEYIFLLLGMLLLLAIVLK
jgi:hypothetical protein